MNNSQIIKREINQITTIDNNISRQFISINQNDFLSNNNTNLTGFKTQDIQNTSDKNITNLQQQTSPIYVNNSYSREYINELKVNGL